MLIVVVLNRGGQPLSTVTTSISIDAAAGGADAAAIQNVTATELFAAAHRTLTAHVSQATDGTSSTTTMTIVDSMDALSTRVYRVPLSADGVPMAEPPTALPAVTKDPNAPNLIFNAGFEFCSNVGSADGQ